jgi:hypothetical protein
MNFINNSYVKWTWWPSSSLNTKEFINGLYTNLKIINTKPSQNMKNIQFENIIFLNPWITLPWILRKIQFLLVLELLWLSIVNDYIFVLTQNKNHNGQHHFFPRLSNWCDMPILHQTSCRHLSWRICRIHKDKHMKILVTTWAGPCYDWWLKVFGHNLFGVSLWPCDLH